MFNDTPIAGGDVVFKTNVGKFKGEMAEIEAVYGRTTGAMSDEALKLAVAQEKLNRAIAQQGPESYAAGRATLAYRTQVDELAKSEAAAAAAARRAAEQRLAAYGAAARNVGSTLTRFVTLPTALLTAAAVKLGVDFQQQMLLIQTQAGASAAEVHRLSGEVLQLAKVTPQGPGQLAQGLYHLESVGLRGAKAMHTLRISALAAGMGISDLESTATALGSVVVTGIKGTENYQHAMALLVGTVGAGNMRMEDLAGSLGNVAPAAAAAGIDLTELGAAMATLTDRGFSSDEAATRLRMSLALIQSPSAKARKALADMGVDADKLGVMLRQPNGLLKVLETLHTAIQRVGAARGNRDLLAGFGGGKSGLGIQTLVQSLDSSVSSYAQKLQQVDRQSQQFAKNQEAYLHSEAYKLHTALSTIESDLTSAGGKIAPVFVGAAGAIAKLVDVFGKLPTASKLAIGVLVGLFAVGGPLLIGIAAVIRAVQTIGKAFQRIPAQAAPAIAETEGELAALRASAAETGAAMGVAGAEGGAALAAGVETGTAEAAASVSALRLSILGLGGLAVAPIVIPIVYDIYRHLVDSHGGIAGQQKLLEADYASQIKAGLSLSQIDLKLANLRHQGLENDPIFKILTKARQELLSEHDPNARLTEAQAQQLRKQYESYGVNRIRTGPQGRHRRHSKPLAPPHRSSSGSGAGGGRKFTTTLPTELQLKLARAQLSGDVAAEHAALQEEKQFLLGELRIARRDHNRAEELQAIQALQSVQDDLDSLAKTGQTAAKQTTSERQKAYQAKLDAEENKLKINLARAKLAEQKAGQNKTALDRAYKAERRALTDEIDFYRKEARDQQLALKERQHYAKLALAAETARAKVGKSGATSSSKGSKTNLAQAESEFLSQLRDVFLTFAPNVFQDAAALRPHVTVNQSFPAPPVDQHRQARMAVGAMKALWDG